MFVIDSILYSRKLGYFYSREWERRRSLNKWLWKWTMGQESMTDIRPFQFNNIIYEFLIFIPESIISMLSSSSCLEKSLYSWISFSWICLNDALSTVEYNSYTSSLSMLLPGFLSSRTLNHTWGFGSRKLATVIAHIKTLAT